MVHMESYTTTCSKLFRIISNCVKKLVVRNLKLIVEIMNVGIYLLDLHPHLWTSVANSPNFSMEIYSSSLKKMYHEFLLITYFFNSNPTESTNITNLELAGLLSHFSCCNVMAKAGCANF